MISTRIRTAVGGMVVVASLLLAACGGPSGKPGSAGSSASPAGSALISRETGGNEGITVTVGRTGDAVLDQPGNGTDLSSMKGRAIPFAITLDTHSGDISKLDLNGKVFIRDSAGVELPAAVRQLSSSSHHTTHAAAFPQMDSRGKRLDDPSQGSLQIIIKGVGRTETRVLEWKP